MRHDRVRSQHTQYRCPAAAYGLECAGGEQCHQAGGVDPGDCGRIVRIDLDAHDRRIFVPTPHGSPSWQRGYNRRNALEWINNRVDNSFDDGSLTSGSLRLYEAAISDSSPSISTVAAAHSQSPIRPINPPANISTPIRVFDTAT